MLAWLPSNAFVSFPGLVLDTSIQVQNIHRESDYGPALMQ